MNKSPRIKETSLASHRTHSAMPSTLEIMKWNDIIETYHHLKQTHQINNSIQLINTQLREKQGYGIEIEDVPFVQSQQMETYSKISNSMFSQESLSSDENFTDREDSDQQEPIIANMRRTAYFVEDQLKENISQNKKILQCKSQKEKYRQILKADQQYLGKVLRKDQK